MLLHTEAPPALSSVTLLRRYPADDVRRMQFQFEDEFSELIGKQQAQPIGPFDGPPNQPRFVLTDGKRTLAVSNISAQLSLDFGKALPPGQNLSRVLQRPAAIMDAALKKILGHQQKACSAIIVIWFAADRDLNRLGKELATDVLKATFSDPVVWSSVGVGIQSKGFNRTIEVSPVKTFQAAALTGNRILSFDSDFDQPDQSGLQIKLDVNTKPQLDDPQKAAFSSIIPILVQSIETDLPLIVPNQLVGALAK